MAGEKENIVYGATIPNYMLNSQSNLSQFFTRLLSEYGSKTAMIDSHDGATISFGSILNTSLNIASWLKYECGIQKSDIIGIFSENSIWYPSIILAIWHVGATCALFNPMYNNKELQHVLRITKPKLMITSKIGLNIVRDVAQEMNFIKYVCPINIIVNARTIQDISNFVPTTYENSQTCVILFSSGTTGLPKGVELTHKSILLMSSLGNMDLTDSDVLMGLVPMFHGYGMLLICFCMTLGCKIVILKYFEEELFLKSIEVHKITILFAVPPLLVFLAKHPLVDKFDLSCIKVIYSGAAPLSLDIQKDVKKRIGKCKPLQVLQGYGMTELTILTTFNLNDEATSDNGSVGKLISGMSGKVMDLHNGKSLGVKECGELCFKGPMVMKGYYGNSKETSSIIDANGWLHTGDIGYYDKDYNFYIVDRIKELIKYKGYQVAPAELESLLLTHPEISDAAVTAIPNVEAGEVPMAFIVKSQNSTLSEKDIINFVHSQVSSQKRLRGGVQFVSSIPKNPSGKIVRRMLKSLINKSKI